PLALGLLVAPLKVGNDTFKSNCIAARMPMLRGVANGQRLRCAIEHLLTLLLSQVAPASIQAKVVLPCQGLQNRCVPLASIDDLAPWGDSTFKQAQLRMSDNQFSIDL